MSDTEVLSLLRSIDERLSRLEEKAKMPESLEQIPLPNEFNILVDTVDELMSPATASGQQNLEAISKLKELFEVLSKPETIDAFTSLTNTMKNLAPLIEQVGELENIFCILTDSVDEIMQKAMESGINIEELSKNLKSFSFDMVNLMESGALTKLLESGILDQKSINVVGALGQSLAVSQVKEKEVGPFKLLGALFNKDIQRSLGFGMNIAVHFGRKLQTQNKK